MAYIGLVTSKWWPLASGKYTAGITIGKSTKCDIKFNKASGDLYADDGSAEHDEEITDADITVGCDDIAKEVITPIWGHVLEEASGAISYDKTDAASYGGFSTVQTAVKDGVHYWDALFLYKTKFGEADISAVTKGNSITYSTPEFSGKAIYDSNGHLMKRQRCATLEAANAFLNTCAGVTP